MEEAVPSLDLRLELQNGYFLPLAFGGPKLPWSFSVRKLYGQLFFQNWKMELRKTFANTSGWNL